MSATNFARVARRRKKMRRGDQRRLNECQLADSSTLASCIGVRKGKIRKKKEIMTWLVATSVSGLPFMSFVQGGKVKERGRSEEKERERKKDLHQRRELLVTLPIHLDMWQVVRRKGGEKKREGRGGVIGGGGGGGGSACSTSSRQQGGEGRGRGEGKKKGLERGGKELLPSDHAEIIKFSACTVIGTGKKKKKGGEKERRVGGGEGRGK